MFFWHLLVVPDGGGSISGKVGEYLEADAHLEKPVSTEVLLERVANLISYEPGLIETSQDLESEVKVLADTHAAHARA